MKLKILIFCLITLPQIVSANSNLQITALYQQATTGNAAAQLAYAKALLPTSKTQAFKWAQKAADQGLGEAWFWMGENSSTADSLNYYKKAVESSYTPAYSNLVDYYLWQGKNSDYNKAKEYADLAEKKGVLIGQNKDDSKQKQDTINYCAQAGLPTLPPTDLPTSAVSASFMKVQDCDAFFFGLGVKKDLVKYRQCLTAQKDVNNNISLAEIYANGWGVARNPKLALALICHSEGLAPAELYGTVNTLYKTRNLKRLPKEFDFCEHVTSGANMGVCASKDEKLATAKRSTILARITAKWPESHQQLFAELQKAADDFFDTHSTSELDMSGTARNAIAISEKSSLQNNFINSIKNFEAGHLPTNNNIAQADLNMNSAYSKVMKKDYSNYQMGSINKEDIKTTQRKWLKYRDLWLKFATLHYPNIKSGVWQTWLTENRTKQINAIVDLN